MTGLFFILYTAFLLFVSVRTWQRNEIYNDPQRYYTLLTQTDTPYRFYGYQQLARTALEKGELEKAHFYLNVARAQEFRSELTHEFLGHYFLQKHKPQEALWEFKLAYYYSGAGTQPLQFVGSTLIELGRYHEALKVFLLAHRLTPDSAISYRQLMTVYELLNQPEKVRRWATAGLHDFQAKPENIPALLMALARFEYRQGHWEASKERLEQIVKKYPSAPGNVDLARLCLGFTGPLSAEQFLQLAEERNPYLKKSSAIFMLMAHVLQGKKAETLQQLRKNHKKLTALSYKNPLIKRELRIAQKFAHP